MVTDPNIAKPYLVANIKATASAEGQVAIKEQKILVSSLLQWIPGIEGLFTEPANDNIFVSNAFSMINSIGSSQIYDAVRLAAQRMIDFKLSNSVIQDYKGVMFLLTDGDENSSEYSLDQAIE